MNANNKTIVKGIVAVLLLALALVQLISLAMADPAFPDSIIVGNIERKTESGSDQAQVIAYAGNLTELTINTQQVTKNWQGFYGNITGEIVLDDTLNMSMYVWDLVDPVGEVYASRNNSLNWTGGNIICVNDTINVTGDPNTAEGNPANPVWREEDDMNTNSEMSPGMQARDGVNETFNISYSHPAFNVSNNGFTANSCRYTAQLFSNDVRQPQAGAFWNETLIWSHSDKGLIYMAYINPNRAGFDNTDYDFQMLVAEDGHMDDESSTTYYLWVELE